MWIDVPFLPIDLLLLDWVGQKINAMNVLVDLWYFVVLMIDINLHYYFYLLLNDDTK